MGTLTAFVTFLPLAYTLQGIPAAATGVVAGLLCAERVTAVRATAVLFAGAVFSSWIQWADIFAFGWQSSELQIPALGAGVAALCLSLYKKLSPNISSKPDGCAAA
jgi:hypothetical protein